MAFFIPCCVRSQSTPCLFLAALHHLSDTMRYGRRQSGSSNQFHGSLYDVPPSPSSCSDSSVDEDEMNCRMKPFWPKYQPTFKRRGFQLDTLKDVKLLYNQRSEDTSSNRFVSQNFHQDTTQDDDDSLCPDAGLVRASSHGLINIDFTICYTQPDNLFRGTRISDAKRIMVKAVHPGSREYDVIWTLSRPPLRDDPMNHTIRESFLLHNTVRLFLFLFSSCAGSLWDAQ